MKRIGNVRDAIVSEENCRMAIKDAARKKRHRPDVRRILDNLDDYAYELSSLLANLSYEPGPYRPKRIVDPPSGKVRNVLIPAFWPDLCVQHAIVRVIAPMATRRMYYWSCGSINARGNKHARIGVERATLHDTKHAKYCAKGDVIHCYDEMKPAVVFHGVCKMFKDAWLLEMLRKIIYSRDGLPIGNFTSPWLCNIVLTPVDFYIKQTVRIRHFVRYADDICLVDSNKRKLRKAMQGMIERLGKWLGLVLHSNWQIFKVRREGDGRKNRPIDFVGHRFCLGYTLLRRRNALALMRQSRRIRKTMWSGISYKQASGFVSRAAQCNGIKALGLARKCVKVIPTKKLKEVIRNESKKHNRPGLCVCG